MKTFILLALWISSFSYAQTKISVSGLSSGAYMAQQFHTAFSRDVEGVGIIAGGPYYCSQGNIGNAFNLCMKTLMGAPDVNNSLNEAKSLFSQKLIDDPRNIKNSRVYILTGTKDETVLRQVVDVVYETYKSWGAHQIRYENKIAVGHAMPTEHFGNTCSTTSQSPYISNCRRDIAGEILNHLLGPLEPKKMQKNSRFFTFDQLQGVAAADVDTVSMNKYGYAYVPEGCEHPEAAGCRIHVAFHGCLQSLDHIQTMFITKAGYNEWAEANKIVVVYPQNVKNLLSNPNACWDWWGYSGSQFHTKNGLQMKRVMKLVEAIRGGSLQLRQANL